MNKLIASVLAVTLGLAALAQPQAAAAHAPQALFQPRESALLQAVTQSVNASHVAGSALPSDPDGVWDCDNYALTKYRSLRDDYRWPPTRLALGVVRLPDGQKHMVVLARAEGGWAILDNLTDEIVPLAERTREHWRVEFAAVEPMAAGTAAWVLVPRELPIAYRG